MDVFFQLGKSCKVWGQLHKNAVAFHAAHDTCDRFADTKALRVFRPRAEQLAVAERDAVLVLHTHHGANIHADREPLLRVVDARNRNGIDGQEGNNTAADIRKRTERLQMRDAHRDHITAGKPCYVLCHAALLCFSARQHRCDPAERITNKIRDDKAHRLIHT